MDRGQRRQHPHRAMGRGLPIHRFRHDIPLHRQTTSCLETLAFIIALYHFATGGYLMIREMKEWLLDGRHQRSYVDTDKNQTHDIKTPLEAFDHLILPFACRAAYQFLSCALGMFLANGIGQKNEETAPKCLQWLVCMTTLNVNSLLLLHTYVDFYVICWNVVRAVLETCAVFGFMTEINTDERDALMRQEILDRYRARAHAPE